MVTQSKQINNIDYVALTAQKFQQQYNEFNFCAKNYTYHNKHFDNVVNINAQPNISAKNVHKMCACNIFISQIAIKI